MEEPDFAFRPVPDLFLPEPLDEAFAGARLRAGLRAPLPSSSSPFAALIEASSAAIRSGTGLASSAGGADTAMSSPSALRSMRSSTRSRYSSRYFSGSNSDVSEPMSCSAISSSRLLAFVALSASGSSSRRSTGTTSSWKSMVDIVSTSPAGRIATRLSFERITTLATATLPACSIASSSSR